jgi:hypothetical protein
MMTVNTEGLRGKITEKFMGHLKVNINASKTNTKPKEEGKNSSD